MNKFVNTRDEKDCQSDTKAIIKGLANNGGLYTPTDFKSIDINDLDNNSLENENIDYKKIAFKILSHFFDSFQNEKLKESIDLAYDKFYSKEVVPITNIGDDYLMELYHGPTSAFKDIALTMLPHLMTMSYEIEKYNKLIYILCATSGDTGKAALEGFKNVKNTFITVFYPNNSVSKIQQLQMTTTAGDNTNVVSVNSNFDKCQTIVKNAMNNRDNLLNDKIDFSSANSINIGRLIPQVAYYFSSYFRLVNRNEIKMGDNINFSVPTGNFGDILAGYFAKKLGLPIDKLICASNKNNVLTDFINTGIYDANRNFYETLSPSMDILISSNLERLLFYESNCDYDYICDIMKKLNENKKFEIKKDILLSIKNTFVSYYATDDDIINTIKSNFIDKNRLIDTHTACAAHAVLKFNKEYNSKNKTVILSTASPFKFANSVYKSITNKTNPDEFKSMKELSDLSGENIPPNLSNIDKLTIMHKDNINFEDGINYIKNKITDLAK